MRPLIGISAGMTEKRTVTVHEINFKRIVEAGGAPFILPNTLDEKTIEIYAESLHGLLLTGGPDLDPLIFDEEPLKELGKITPDRDFFEIKLAQAMYERRKPIFGICRGSQVLNVATGGTLYQDIYVQHEEKLLKHGQDAPREYATHFIEIERDSKLFDIVKQEKIKVNTYHHQAIKDPGKDIYISSRASDSVVESIESKEHPFAIGVQWHPEYLEDEASKALFTQFIQATQASV